MSSLEPVRKPESRVPIAPQMAWRVAMIGTIALVLFGIVFFRLWYLQILTGNHYLAEAKEQKTRPLPVQAPRGQILARNGATLVSSETTSAVQIVPSKLPESLEAELTVYRERLEESAEEAAPLELQARAAETRLAALKSSTVPVAARRRLQREDHREVGRLKHELARARVVTVPPLMPSARRDRGLFKRLGGLLRISPHRIYEEVIQKIDITPYAPVTIDSDVAAGPRAVIAEHASEFPGVEQGPVAVRAYPHGEMAAQIVGHVGPVTAEELENPAFKGVPEGSIVGQNGLEYYYDSYLRGTPGKRKVQVDANGEPIASAVKEEVQPKAGYDLETTIDLPLQVEAESALREEIEAAHGRGQPADGAAFVAMDPLSGEILAIGSYPSYNPGFFTKPFTEAEYDALSAPAEGASGGSPLLDRAVSGGYPTGSTFKPITAMAALENGVISPTESFGNGTFIEVGGIQFHNDESANYGSLDLVQALEVSSDVYFFTVGKDAYEHGGNVIQKMAHELGVGDELHIDLPESATGTVPDRRWLEEMKAAERRCIHERRPGANCEYVEKGAVWAIGDNMNLAIGQGDLLTDPLQMALAYSTLVDAYRNGGHGWRPTPHLGKQVDDADGELVSTLKFPRERRHVELNESNLAYVFEGIHDATVGPQGTSTTDWAGWNESLHPTYGKTGTAERFGEEPQSWYMCYVESEKRPLVIAVTVEEGGYGAETAAPIARLMADQYFNQGKTLVAGKTVPETAG